MLIRQAQPPDARSISNLLAQLGYPDIQEEMALEKIKIHTMAGYHMLIAEIDSQVVGFIALHWFELSHWEGRMGRMTAFCIDEKFRSRGIGKKLLDASEKFLHTQGCIKFEVTSNARRTRTHGFYLKNGYQEDSKRFVKYPVVLHLKK